MEEKQCEYSLSYKVLLNESSPIYHQKLFYGSHGIVNKLPDSSFTANQSYNGQHGPENCRIGAAKKGNNSWGWAAKANGDYITIDLLESYLITGIATASRGDCGQWTTKYSIQISSNGIDWVDNGQYIGNFEKTLVVKNKLLNPMPGRFVRLKILSYNSHPSLRLDVLVNDHM